MNSTKEKPMVVNVNRYYRPYRVDFRLDDCVAEKHTYSDRGVTIMFTLDYNERTFTAKWSICNGDNFSKAIGIAYAQACAHPVVGPLPLEPGVKLIDMVLGQIENILDVPADLQDKTVRRNIELLKEELRQSE